jgi:hypothetical protein
MQSSSVWLEIVGSFPCQFLRGDPKSSSDFRPKEKRFSLKKNEGLGMLPIIGGKKIKLREKSSQMKT